MKRLIIKLFIMVLLYLTCNYLIWFDIYPCLTDSYVETSFFLGVYPKNSLFIPLCLILPIVLFQPWMFMLCKIKPLVIKKGEIIIKGASLAMAAITIGVWLVFIQSIKQR